ncbi:hypothetical protein E2C01_058464 [Portunus trituberculatus]|uniref:Uncharacterized protein n=1 Tax=Portunus trituberculatus TaxID=210409 RepID=A0A5B7GWI3_PORTR|nr:hypothetical protein [Portunus trituberculatus]
MIHPDHHSNDIGILFMLTISRSIVIMTPKRRSPSNHASNMASQTSPSEQPLKRILRPPAWHNTYRPSARGGLAQSRPRWPLDSMAFTALLSICSQGRLGTPPAPYRR